MNKTSYYNEIINRITPYCELNYNQRKEILNDINNLSTNFMNSITTKERADQTIYEYIKIWYAKTPVKSLSDRQPTKYNQNDQRRIGFTNDGMMSRNGMSISSGMSRESLISSDINRERLTSSNNQNILPTNLVAPNPPKFINNQIRERNINPYNKSIGAVDIATYNEDHNEPEHMDIHEILKTEIGSVPETTNTDSPILTDDSKPNIDNIQTIFGTSAPLDMQRIFNPRALEQKAYAVLDRKYQSLTSNNVTSFSWQLSNTSLSIAYDNSIGVNPTLKDIVMIRMLPFVFPSTLNAVNEAARLSVAITQLNTQSISAIEQSRRYHFLFTMTKINNLLQTNGFDLGEIGNGLATFEFYKPIEQLTNITITFGNPFTALALDIDRSYATWLTTSVPIGGATQITLTIPVAPILTTSPIPGGDILQISNFRTAVPGHEDDPSYPNVDSPLLDLINAPNGWRLISQNTITNTYTLQILILNYTTTLVNPPYVRPDGYVADIYFDSKRFIIPLDFTFRRYEM